MNIGSIKTANTSKPKYEEDIEEVESEENQNEQIDVQQPDYGELEGEKIKLNGLDYSLLQKQKNKQRQTFLSSLKNKLNYISSNAAERVKEQSQQQKNSKAKMQVDKSGNFGGLFRVLESRSQKKENKRTQSYFIFQLDQFSSKTPMIVQKRIGKATSQAVYSKIQDDFLKQFSKLSRMRDRKGQAQTHNTGAIRQEIDAENNSSNSDDEQLTDQCSIFGCDSAEVGKKQSKGVNIEIGKKLRFDDIEDDIFGKKRASPISDLKEKQEEQQQKDKYFFMRKKIKRNVQQDDGYGECYYQTGPSLNELVQLKKQGIQYYGDAKQFKQKERRKPNIHKQYEMIQSIIEKKKKQ